MKFRTFTALMATVLAIAPLTSTSPTFGQNATTSKGQQAINIAAKLLGVSTGELQVVSEVNVNNITRIKVVHPQTGRLAGINLDQNNNEVPVEQVQGILANRRGQNFKGKLETELANKLSSSQSTASTSVIVWVSTPKVAVDRTAATGGEAEVQTQAIRNFHKNATAPVRQFLEASGATVKYQAEYAPLLVVNVPNALFSALVQRNDVHSIQLERTYKSELNVSVPSIDAPTVWSRGYTGSGVKVAVVEDDGIYFAHSSLADGTYCNSTTPNIGSHATGVAGIIASTGSTYKGVAYGAPAILSGNAGSYTDSAIINCTEWAITNGARVINYSFGVDSGSSLVALDRYVDYVVRYDAVTIVKSAGNINSTCFAPENNITSPGKGWNILTVGNYDDKNTYDLKNGDDTMSSTSCYGDPTSPNGDREKPEIAAPGTNITTTYCTSSSTCTGSGSGTSFAAPHAVGCSALLMQRNSSLMYWPESIKAVLMASAVVNLEGSTRLSDQDGAGGIECDSADDVVSGASGLESHGTFSKSNFPKTFTFSANAGQTVRVVIAWDSTTNTASPPTTDDLKADLDLVVNGPGNTYVSGSYSWDNSYEIIEFTAPSTGTYSANVNAYRFDGDSEYLGFAVWKGTREK